MNVVCLVVVAVVQSLNAYQLGKFDDSEQGVLQGYLVLVLSLMVFFV